MKILRHIQVPTGDILVVQGEKGKLEMLSLGDYGKKHNLKANFLGLTREPKRVRHTDLLPLEKKWVITISSQYGCKGNCLFCDAWMYNHYPPYTNEDINATFNDLIKQVITGINLHPEVKSTQRLNIHVARMGEPTWNPNVLDFAKWLKEHIDPEYRVHPVVSTIMPNDNIWLKTFIHTWMRIKNRMYKGEAGLQLSINSTNEVERRRMFTGSAHSLFGIYKIMRGIVPYGRKITLNFAVANWTIDPLVLLKYFDPDDYVVKLTPMHKTTRAEMNNIRTKGDYTTYYPYKETEEKLIDVGYDVLVFIASKEEDEGLITCGNAILSGRMPTIEHKVIK